MPVDPASLSCRDFFKYYHHFDADPDPAFHFDADTDHTFHSDADLNLTCKLDADADPDPDTAFRFGADPDLDPTSQNDADLGPDPQYYLEILGPDLAKSYQNLYYRLAVDCRPIIFAKLS